MADILETICATTRRKVEQQKTTASWAEISNAARAGAPIRPFAGSLMAKVTAGKIGLIAEIKKASPSAGIIRNDFSPSQIASTYADAGATCLSVLTDQPYFQGDNRYLIDARAACSLPTLRKDFMLDVWQVAEARAIGADCILIIMAAVDDATAQSLHQAATDFGMDVLIEVHDERELDRALMLPSGMIGINNRNLKTLTIDLGITEKLARHVGKERLLVCESGISTPADIARMRRAGAHCFLVGESLLKQADIGNAVRTLIG